MVRLLNAEFNDAFRNHTNSLIRNKVLTYASIIQLKDFPTHLPEDFLNYFGDFINSLSKLPSGVSGEKIPIKKEDAIGLIEEKLLTSLTQFCDLKFKERGYGQYAIDDLLYSDFESNVLNNGLVISFAFFESFLNDSFRLIYDVKPQQLKTKKKSIDYETLFSFSNFQDLKMKILDDEVFDFSGKPLNKRFKFFRKWGVTISKKYEKKIVNAEQIRHIIIHNNSIVDQTFLKNTKRRDLEIGEKYSLTISEFDETITIMLALLKAFFIDLSTKVLSTRMQFINEILGLKD